MKIELRKVGKSYVDGAKTLSIIDSLSWEFPKPLGEHSRGNEGSSVAIVGRSGVGKSTLLHILGGLDRPTTGEILFDSMDIARLSQDELAEFRRKTVGFIFQFHHLLPEFTAAENVAMPLIIGDVDDAEAHDRAIAALQRVGLDSRSEHRPGQLSGGEQQRVAIARAIVAEPKVIFADEPTGNLDFQTARDIQALLIDLNKRLNNILVVVTHNDELARSLSCAYEMLPGGNLAVKKFT